MSELLNSLLFPQLHASPTDGSVINCEAEQENSLLCSIETSTTAALYGNSSKTSSRSSSIESVGGSSTEGWEVLLETVDPPVPAETQLVDPQKFLLVPNGATKILSITEEGWNCNNPPPELEVIKLPGSISPSKSVFAITRKTKGSLVLFFSNKEREMNFVVGWKDVNKQRESRSRTKGFGATELGKGMVMRSMSRGSKTGSPDKSARSPVLFKELQQEQKVFKDGRTSCITRLMGRMCISGTLMRRLGIVKGPPLEPIVVNLPYDVKSLEIVTDVDSNDIVFIPSYIPKESKGPLMAEGQQLRIIEDPRNYNKDARWNIEVIPTRVGEGRFCLKSGGKSLGYFEVTTRLGEKVEVLQVPDRCNFE